MPGPCLARSLIGQRGFSYYLDAHDGGAYFKRLKQQGLHAGAHASPHAGAKWGSIRGYKFKAHAEEGFGDGQGRVRLCKVDAATADLARLEKWGAHALGAALPPHTDPKHHPPGYRWEWWRLRQYFVTLVFTDIQGTD